MKSLITSLLSGATLIHAAAIWPTHSFHTTVTNAPILNITKSGPTAPGFLFIAPSTSTTGSPAIYADTGDLVWHGPEGKTYAYQPQTLHGEPVLTFWQGHNVKGFGYGHISILDASYEEIHRVTLPGSKDNTFVTATNESFPSYIDIHESAITEHGTILVTAVNVTQTDLTSVGGERDGWVQDGLVYEIDIETNEVLFRWSAVEHSGQLPLEYAEYPLNDAGRNSSVPYEYPHLNSVAKYGDTYLVSSRYMCSIFLLDKKGDLVWLFHGQNGGTYTLPSTPGSTFCYQHDARIHAHTYPGHPNETITLSLHNNDNTDATIPRRLTTGLVFNLHPFNKSATLVSRTYDARDPVSAVSQGNYQVLPSNGTGTGLGGHYVAGHGAVPKIEEYDAAGKVVMRGWFGAKIENSNTSSYDWTSYRAYKENWVGRPRSRPSIAACREEGEQKVDVWVSWNGATDVKGWRIYGLSSSSQGERMRILRDVAKSGFETRAVLEADINDIKVGEGSADTIIVEAIGGVGEGTKSEAVRVGSCSTQ
ncbi:ASST-domain-containing protein [Aspergillus nidulans var. acristatus]